MEKMEFTKSRRIKVKKKKLERIYDKKPLIEFIVAILSVPSLILLVILNFNSLRSINNAKPTPTPVSNIVMPGINGSSSKFFFKPVVHTQHPSYAVATSQGPCNKSLGPINIISPSEGAVVNDNPVEVDISYTDSVYCGAVWSYRINGSSWSDYNNDSVALYNLPNGSTKFELRARSITSSDSTILTRDFTYSGQSTVIQPTSASNSAY
ncbi:MAG TPA: hypothetical protein VNW29_05680 [Candidatus Sulfotelmatobacter sp.]|nr:hypothetical protein [Candidatus Sulfotelmatobacter sp.]